jgi:hypothetical protein
MLSIGHSRPKWTRANTSGRHPSGRIGHQLTHYPEGNLIVVSGGKRPGLNSLDLPPATSLSPERRENSGGRRETLKPARTEVLNDIFILKLDTFEWIEVVAKGLPFPYLANHSAILNKSRLLIFGGMRENYKYSKDLYVVELEWANGKKIYDF